MDLNDLLIFAKVVQARSFTGGARALGLPKSTVSRRVSRLEERLGARLLQRTTRTLSLTDAGATYYAHCARIIAEMEEAELSVTRMQAAPRGTLRLTAPVDFGVAFLGELLALYLKGHAEVSVDVLLTDRVVDLAVRLGPLADSTLIARRLGTARGQLCASPSYLTERGSPRSPEELKGHDCIVFVTEREHSTWTLAGAGGTVAISVGGRARLNNMALVHRSALAGLGIAQLPLFQCAEDLRAGRLRTVLEGWCPPEIPIHAVYPSTRHLSVKVRAFLDLLGETMQPPPWEIAPLL